MINYHYLLCDYMYFNLMFINKTLSSSLSSEFQPWPGAWDKTCWQPLQLWIWVLNLKYWKDVTSSIKHPQSITWQSTNPEVCISTKMWESASKREPLIDICFGTHSQSQCEAKLCWSLTSIIRKCCLSIELDLCHWRNIAALSPFAVSMYPIYE